MQARLLNRNRVLIAVLDRVTAVEYSRRAREATPLSVSVPREDVKLADAQLAMFLELWDRSRLLASGKITARDTAEDTVTLSGLTEEALLSGLCPAQYERVYSGLDLADAVRLSLDGWHTLRVKAPAQWDAAVVKSQVDLTTQPGTVLLAKNSSGAYRPSGYITLRFLRSSIPGFKSWDRIRWLSDYDDVVSTTMQYRYGNTPSNLTAYSPAFRGSLPDKLGVIPGTLDAAILDVRLNLATDDTTSPNIAPNEEADLGLPTAFGVTPFVFALEVIARTHGEVTPGDMPATSFETVRGVRADYTSSLAVIREMTELAGWEFDVRQGKLNLKKQLGTSRLNDFVLTTSEGV